MADNYIFPNMDIPELIDSLREWGFPVSYEQLVRPTPEFIMSIYSACLEQVTDLNFQTLQKPTQDALNSLDDPNPVRSISRWLKNVLIFVVTGPLCC